MSSYCGVRPLSAVANSSWSLASTEGWRDSGSGPGQSLRCGLVASTIKIVTASSRTSLAVIPPPVSASRGGSVAPGDLFGSPRRRHGYLLTDLPLCRIH